MAPRGVLRAVPLTLLAAGLACSLGPFSPSPPTSSPSSTPTAPATVSLTPTPAAPPASATPGAVEPAAPVTRRLPDGSTEVSDSLLGYRLALPPGWLMLGLGPQETEALLEQAGQLNPDLAGLFEAFGAQVAQGTRFVALGPDERALDTGYFPTISLTTLGDIRTPISTLVQSTAGSIELLVPDSEVISQQVMADLNGRQAGRLDLAFEVTTLLNTRVSVRSIVVMVQSETQQLLQLSLQCQRETFPEYEGLFEATIGTLTILPAQLP